MQGATEMNETFDAAKANLITKLRLAKEESLGLRMKALAEKRVEQKASRAAKRKAKNSQDLTVTAVESLAAKTGTNKQPIRRAGQVVAAKTAKDKQPIRRAVKVTNSQ